MQGFTSKVFWPGFVQRMGVRGTVRLAFVFLSVSDCQPFCMHPKACSYEASSAPTFNQGEVTMYLSAASCDSSSSIQPVLCNNSLHHSWKRQGYENVCIIRGIILAGGTTTQKPSLKLGGR